MYWKTPVPESLCIYFVVIKMFKIQIKNMSVRDYTLKYLAERETKKKEYIHIKDGRDDVKEIPNGSYFHC